MAAKELLEDSLVESPIAFTKGFEWYATPIGIAALSTTLDYLKPDQLSRDAIDQGLEIGLELTKEEQEFHSCLKGIVIIFYS